MALGRKLAGLRRSWNATALTQRVSLTLSTSTAIHAWRPFADSPCTHQVEEPQPANALALPNHLVPLHAGFKLSEVLAKTHPQAMQDV